MEQQMPRDNEGMWVRCPECGHKLFKTISDIRVRPAKIAQEADIQTKCHSCKQLVNLKMDK